MARDAREQAKTAGDTIGASINDAWIHTKITSKLIGDRDTPARKINVDVVDGIVTLRGQVSTANAKDEADRIAKDTEGVRRVRNLLKVTAG
jgi:osmotically-inducible protein OsmY